MANKDITLKDCYWRHTHVAQALFSLYTVWFYLFIYLFIHYATEAAHITLQTYKIKHKVKTQKPSISLF